ncbi:MAG: 4-(cytidine 5'-diphospho)-2-C-methyl-D-erythritol kinase [Candidatus Endonucleobacter bathymodioli]|uniref:4-diphosphocytidyl-2-C-methyl-D-erythritol kinase n=1 Tax=Candidatus Endonucleibacter bathymodioli TaxID=539814 RepID=A0AA90SSS1_9GAMM|nr:4-(cytidine 5'-diphospho)-2-C-methyl-D-erythritol kinase [Candidatus Endonucleobacter bathymodioli]
MYASNKLVLPAPAKINRFLYIIGRRADGYHQIQTLFQFLDYGDELVFEHYDSLELETQLSELQTDSNLVIKAAKLLQQKTGCSKGARIYLDKKLPINGGVGGGSSNAATTLLGLNRLWALGLEEESLAELGLQLGADVPVFVRGRSAFAEGVGELLTPVSPSTPWYLVLIPDAHVNTKAMYGHDDLIRDTRPITVFDALEQDGRNDFEPLVRKLYPEVESCLKLLDNYRHLSIGSPMLSGSGACVFSSFPNQESAMSTLAELGLQARGFVAQGSNRSLLHTVLR